MPLLELQEGIRHELWADIEGMHPYLSAMSQQIRSRLTVYS